MDKIEKMLYFYLFIFYVILVTVFISAFVAGPLILGLLFSPYWFLGYIFTAIMAPILVLIVTMTPSIYRLLMEE